MSEAKPISQRFKESIQHFYERFDVESWPALLMFLVVVTLGMGMNYIVMRQIVGDFLAILISFLFESGILAWKVMGWRKKNNEAQDETINWATYGSVFLALLMLAVNLFRVEGDTPALFWAGNGIIAMAALLHVVAYLRFDQDDSEKRFNRDVRRDENSVKQVQHASRHMIDKLQSDMNVVRMISQELHRIDEENRDLPDELRKPLMEKARQELFKQYGGNKAQEAFVKPQTNRTPVQTPASHPAQVFSPTQAKKEAPREPEKPSVQELPSISNPKNYDLTSLLISTGKNMLEMKQMFGKYNGDCEEAYRSLWNNHILPPDMNFENFSGLFEQIKQANPT